MLGTTQHASGDLAAAIESYKRGLAVAPDAALYTNLGVALTAGARLPEAAHAFEEAVRLAPRSPAKHRNLGDVYAKLGAGAMARKAYQRAAELCRDELHTNPRDGRLLSMLAVYEAKMGRHDDAGRHASEAVALATTVADVVYRRAVVLALGGRAADSLSALEQAFALGYSRSMANDDDDLNSLRASGRFKRLLAGPTAAPAPGGGG